MGGRASTAFSPPPPVFLKAPGQSTNTALWNWLGLAGTRGLAARGAGQRPGLAEEQPGPTRTFALSAGLVLGAPRACRVVAALDPGSSTTESDPEEPWHRTLPVRSR